MSLKDRLTTKETVAGFVSVLLFSRNQAQVLHWQTNSYAQHKAFEDYYNSIMDLVDSLVESYQSTNSIITMFNNDEKYIYNKEGVDYFKELLNYIKNHRKVVSEDSDIQNIIDEIISLIKSTIYKLEKLS